jgi:hypothetical protein
MYERRKLGSNTKGRKIGHNICRGCHQEKLAANFMLSTERKKGCCLRADQAHKLKMMMMMIQRRKIIKYRATAVIKKFQRKVLSLEI